LNEKNNKRLKDFLISSNYKNLEIFKKLNCNKEEFLLLRFISNFYLKNQENNFNVSLILTDFSENEKDNKIKNMKEEEIDEENFTELLENDIYSFDYISSFKKLFNLGFLFSFKNEKIENLNIFEFNAVNFYINNDILDFIINGEFKSFEEIKGKYFSNYNEYLEDMFLLINLELKFSDLQSLNIDNKSIVFQNIKKIFDLNKNLFEIKLKNNKNNFDNKISNFIKDNNLNEFEEKIIYFLIKNEYENHNIFENNLEEILAKLLFKKNNILELRKFIFSSKLYLEGMIIVEKTILPLTNEINFDYYLEEDILNKISFNLNNNNNNNNNNELEKNKIFNNKIKEHEIFETIEEKIKLKDITLNKETEKLINILVKHTNQDVMNLLMKWGISKNNEIDSKIIFYGKPGTGKTLTAKGFANAINKKILKFDCSKIFSMYVGESEKNVRNIFEEYEKISKEIGERPILLLNEADQFLSSRVTNANSSVDKMNNQMQNIFLEQIEEFKGIIIATTNLITNIDKAFSRRFNHKIEFKLPNKKERKSIWKIHLPKNAEFEENFDLNKLVEYELSGGQISLIIKNTAYYVATRNNNDFTFYTKDFIEEIKKEKNNSFENESSTVGFLN